MAFLDHLISNKISYIVVASLLISGMVGGAKGQQWLDVHITDIIDTRISGLEEQVRGISELLMEQQMRDLQVLICRSPGERILLVQMSNLQKNYRRMTRSSYQLPSCAALGVTAVVINPHGPVGAFAAE